MAVSQSENNDSCAPLFMGGYDCDFVDPPPDSLQCPVCLLPFRDPTLLSCCGHKGCALCIGRIKAAGHPCPLCQQPFETMLDKHFQRKVLDLRVFCSKKGEGCPWKGELRDLEIHSSRNCIYVAVECQYGCGRRYQRNLLRDHEMDECPQRPSEIVTQSMIRKMAERMDKLDRARQEDQTKLTAVQAKLAAVERARCDDQTELNQEIRNLQEETASLRDDKEMLTRKIVELENRLLLETNRRRKLTRIVDELKDQVECQNTTLHSQIAAAQGPGWLMDSKGTRSSPCTPTTIVMPQFSRHKRDGDEWYSQPFYSQPEGYKLCLRVDANGVVDGKGTHVSVSVRLMKGENDDQLQWPFEHDVTCGILNWKRDENHVMKIIHIKNAPKECQERVTSEERAKHGWGYAELLPHTFLSDNIAIDTQYLHNDCLCLQVLKVEPPKY